MKAVGLVVGGAVAGYTFARLTCAGSLNGDTGSRAVKPDETGTKMAAKKSANLSAPPNMDAISVTSDLAEGLVLGQLPTPTAGPGEILIKAVAAGINRADTLQRKGKYPPPPGAPTHLGLEVTGTVHAVGEGATRFAVGDRVMALLAGGGYAEFAVVPEVHAMPVPANLGWLEAAAIPEVWLTAFQLTHLVGNIRPNDKVLIHAGGSGVGTAAIQLVLEAGATPWVTAGSKTKIDAAVALGAAGGFNRHDGPWAEAAKEATGGSGFDLVLDCVGQAYWQQNAEVLAPDSRWVVYGLLSGANVDGNLLAMILRKRIRITGTTLRARTVEYKAALVAKFSKLALPRFAAGSFKPVVEKAFPLANASEAHALMESNATVGKVLLVMSPELIHSPSL